MSVAPVHVGTGFEQGGDEVRVARLESISLALYYAIKLITLLTKAREYNKLHGRMVYSFILSHQAHPYAQVGEC